LPELVWSIVGSLGTASSDSDMAKSFGGSWNERVMLYVQCVLSAGGTTGSAVCQSERRGSPPIKGWLHSKLDPLYVWFRR